MVSVYTFRFPNQREQMKQYKSTVMPFFRFFFSFVHSFCVLCCVVAAAAASLAFIHSRNCNKFRCRCISLILLHFDSVWFVPRSMHLQQQRKLQFGIWRESVVGEWWTTSHRGASVSCLPHSPTPPLPLSVAVLDCRDLDGGGWVTGWLCANRPVTPFFDWLFVYDVAGGQCSMPIALVFRIEYVVWFLVAIFGRPSIKTTCGLMIIYASKIEPAAGQCWERPINKRPHHSKRNRSFAFGLACTKAQWNIFINKWTK